MAIRQIIKYKRKNVPAKNEGLEDSVVEQNAINDIVNELEEEIDGVVNGIDDVKSKNNQKKNEETMDERVNKAEEIMNNMKAANHVKVVKKDKGLIERTESSKIVLTEDNRQVLND
jgi:hypothetical protein